MDYRYTYNRQQATPVRDYILMGVVMVVASALFLIMFFKALDIRLERQHLMLCESAKVSGNLTVKGCK